MNRLAMIAILPALVISTAIAIDACSPAVNKPLVQVLSNADQICAVVGWDDGTEQKICRAVADIGAILADLLPMSAAAPDGGPPAAMSATKPPARRVISVRVERPPSS